MLAFLLASDASELPLKTTTTRPTPSSLKHASKTLWRSNSTATMPCTRRKADWALSLCDARIATFAERLVDFPVFLHWGLLCLFQVEEMRTHARPLLCQRAFSKEMQPVLSVHIIGAPWILKTGSFQMRFQSAC